MIFLKYERVASLPHKIAFRSTGTMEVVLIDANWWANGPSVASHRDEKSQPDSAADARFVKS